MLCSYPNANSILGQYYLTLFNFSKSLQFVQIRHYGKPYNSCIRIFGSLLTKLSVHWYGFDYKLLKLDKVIYYIFYVEN